MGHVAIIGSGIAGLSAAHELKKAGHVCVVFEASDYAGGRIKTVRKDGFTFDSGAFVCLGSYDETLETAREIGLDDQMEKRPAFGAMPRDGVLHYIDLDHPVRTVLTSNYLSWNAKFKMIKLLRLLVKHGRALNYDTAAGMAEIDADTIQDYCLREFGEEIYDYIGSVVIRGSWLANPEWSSVGQMLWTMKNFFKPYFYGFSGGYDTFPKAIAAQHEVRYNHIVLSVEDRENGVSITYSDSGKDEAVESFDAVIIATPADIALSIYPQMSGPTRTLYETTEYITSVNTHLGLAREPENPATYVMASPKEQKNLSGVIVDTKKASGRAPPGKGNLTVFCPHEWCVEHFEASDEIILEKILGYIDPYFGVRDNRIESYEIARWKQVVPIMRPGRFRVITDHQNARTANSRVQLAGDLEPIGGVNAALVSGRKAAALIGERLS